MSQGGLTRVSRWGDASGQGNDFVQTDPNHAPAQMTGTRFNGQPFLHFDANEGDGLIAVNEPYQFGSDDFLNHWTYFLNDIFRVNTKMGRGRMLWQYWTKEWLRVDRSYADVVREVISAGLPQCGNGRCHSRPTTLTPGSISADAG